MARNGRVDEAMTERLHQALAASDAETLEAVLEARKAAAEDVRHGVAGALDRLGVAEKMLRQFYPQHDDEVIASVLAAHRYLAKKGFKVSQQKLYADRKKGLLKVQPDGMLKKRDVDSYASEHIKRPAEAPDADGGRVREIKERLLAKELEEKELQVEAKKLRLAKQREELISREEVNDLFVRGVTVLRGSMRQFFYSQALAIIEMAGGDPKRTEELIEYLVEASNSWFGGFARKKDFEVVYTDDGDEDDAGALDEAAEA